MTTRAEDEAATEKAERAFRKLMATPKAWNAWCEQTRKAWEQGRTEAQREAWRLHKGRIG